MSKSDGHGKHDLDRVKAPTCREVEIEIRVMHPVKAPQPGHRMKRHVLQVDRQIERQEGDDRVRPSMQAD